MCRSALTLPTTAARDGSARLRDDGAAAGADSAGLDAPFVRAKSELELEPELQPELELGMRFLPAAVERSVTATGTASSSADSLPTLRRRESARYED